MDDILFNIFFTLIEIVKLAIKFLSFLGNIDSIGSTNNYFIMLYYASPVTPGTLLRIITTSTLEFRTVPDSSSMP